MTKTLKCAALASLTLLGGCVSFGVKPPESLLTLSAASSAPAGTAAIGNTKTAIALMPFETPAVLNGTRVPVQINASEMAYLKDAVWAETPARLFRRLVAETLRSKTGRVVIDGDDPAVIADERLTGTIRRFGYDAPSSSVVVVFDAVRGKKGDDVEVRRFEARVENVEPKVSAVGPALNEAANQVAGEIADWMK